MSVLADLETLLAEEQQILLSGDYGRLESLAEKKSALAEKLSDRAPEIQKEAVEKLAAQAAYNETLLSSARRGIQAAISQLKEYSSGEHQSTYSKEGQRQPMSRPVSMTQKY